MTTVSLVECVVTPISLRACGSSNKSLLENRLRLQSCSPEKLMRRTPTPKAKIPDIRGISMPPACVEVPSRGASSIAYSSPIKWQYECRSDEYSGAMTSSSEFSDEDLTEVCGSQEVAKMLSHDKHDDLRIVGSKPKLHTMFEVPVIKSPQPKKPIINETTHHPERNDSDPELARDCTSPENPPPSPINFLPPLDGFVIGGKKLKCPEKTDISLSYSARDFVPGFVKYPLYHCKQCEGRVLDEEQTPRRPITNRRFSSHSHKDSLYTSRLGHRAQMYTHQDPLALRYLDSSPQLQTCHHGNRSFLEIYSEKKKLKEKRERERNGRESRCTPTLTGHNKQRESGDTTFGAAEENCKPVDLQVSDKPDSTTDISGGVTSSTDGSKDTLTPGRYIQAVRRTPDSKVSPYSPETTDSQWLQQEHISDLSVVQTVEESEIRHPIQPGSSVQSDSQLHPVKCQLRGCLSDIWPFPDNLDRVSPNHPVNVKKIPSNRSVENFSLGGPSSDRVTPYCPLPKNTTSQQHITKSSKSNESLKLVRPNVESSVEAMDAEVNDKAVPDQQTVEASHSEEDEEEDLENDGDNITLTATVIVPSQDKPCSQWVSFNAEHEPVLNNAPVNNDACDNFLKRLQKTKLSSQDQNTSIPPGKQFCFEPMIDKRYNRWKRRRRKKKEIANHRSLHMTGSESSDDEEDANERQMERIIDHMYEEIHGPIPETPNGSSDTPRMRNRRRRNEIASGSQTKCADGIASSSDLHYDASSEWVASDKSEDDEPIITSEIGVRPDRPERTAASANCEHSPVHFVQARDVQSAQLPICDNRDVFSEQLSCGPERSQSSPSMDRDECNWPFLDQYREELLERVKSSPTDDIMNKDWLPPIPCSAYPTPDPLQAKCEVIIKRAPAVGEAISTLPDNSSVNNSRNIRRKESISSNSQIIIKPKVQKPLDMPVSTVKEPINTIKLRKPIQSLKPKTPDFRPSSISRSSASNWSEVGFNPKQANRVGIVATGGCPDPRLQVASTTFKAALRPVRLSELPKKERTPIKSDVEQGQTQTKELTLPKLTKNTRSQTLTSIRRRNSSMKIDKKVKQKVKKTGTDLIEQPNTLPQTKKAARTNNNSNGSRYEPRSDFLLREFYLRNVFGNRIRVNSHAKNINRSTRVKQTITVDRLDLGSSNSTNKPEDGKKDEEGSISGLSFTRAFTFSMFDLPDVYKLYNKRIERRVSHDWTDNSIEV